MITGAAFVDLSAAYDTVNHMILIQKASTPYWLALYVELSRICCQVGDYMPIYPGTRSFIYADDLCVTAQCPSFTEVEESIGDALKEIIQYYRSTQSASEPR